MLALLISLEAMENVPPPGIIHIDWKSVSHIDGLNNFGALDNIHAKGLKVAQGGGGARRPRRQAPRRSFDPDAPVLMYEIHIHTLMSKHGEDTYGRHGYTHM